jgi:hypothetical protein
MELSEEEKKLFGGTKSTGDRPQNLDRHGKYLLMIDTWKLFRGRTALVDIHNFITMKSDKNPVTEDGKLREDIPHPAGSRVGCTFKWSNDDAGTMARQNSVKFLLAMFGINEAELSEQDKIEGMQRATNDDPKKYAEDFILGPDGKPTNMLIPSVNPCRGMLISADTTPVFTKTTKKWIVVVNFQHIAPPGAGDNSYEAAAARWAAYEAQLKAA